MKGHNDSVTSISMSPCGKYAVSGGLDKQTILWDLASGKSVHTFSGHDVSALEYDQNGKVVAATGLDGVLSLYDVKEGTHLKNYYAKNTKLINAQFSVRNLMYTLGVYNS
jgi:WD40 repeat protein